MIQYLYLGRIPYGEALRLQDELVALRTADRIGNVLLLLEHPPVLTLGRNANRSNVLASDEMLAARGVTLHEINRGGDVTYHGPGQLVGYPIFDLRSLRSPNGARLPPQRQGPAVGGPGRLGPVDFVRLMEEALIRLCGEFGVPAGRIRGLTGVWCGVRPADGALLDENCAETASQAAERPNCKSFVTGHEFTRAGNANQVNRALAPGGPAGERKIAAIGIHVARSVTSHGFAFNVTTNLDDFRLINPCGITDRTVTSLAKEVADAKSLPSLESIAHCATRHFGQVFGEPVEMLESLAALRAHTVHVL